MSDDTKRRIERRVAQVERRYQGQGRVFKVLWIIAAVTIVLAGLVMIVVPGPALVVVPVGLAMLAAEFAWARRLLRASVDRGVDVHDRLERMSAQAKALGILAIACVAVAAVVVAIVYL